MTSMNQEEALVYLTKTSRNSTANRNIAGASGVQKPFAVPVGPTSGEGQQGEAPGGSFALPLPLQGCWTELPLLHPSSTRNTASTLPQGQEREAKSLCKETETACSTVLCRPPHSKSTGGVTARTAPRQRYRASPQGRDVCFPYLLRAAALQLGLTKPSAEPGNHTEATGRAHIT